MFCTAHIKVDGHPVLFKFLCKESIAVASIDIAEVVPARTSPLRHGIGFADTLTAVSVNHVQPFSCVGQRRLTAVTRLVVLQIRQLNRQLVVVDGRDFAIFPVDDGERFAPVTLTAEEPVTELVVHGSLTDLVGFQPFDHLSLASFLVEAVEAEGVVLAVDVGAVGSPASFTSQHLGLHVFRAGCVRFHDADNRQVELLCEFEVAGIVGGHSHDSAGAVSSQNVVSHPNRNLGAGQRVDGVGAREHAGLFLGEFGTVQVALEGGSVNVGFHSFLLFRGSEGRNQLVFRSHHHVGCAKQGIATGGINAELVFGGLAVCISDCEIHFCTLALADPVLLHVLHALGPIQLIEALQQAVAIMGDTHEPLLQVTAFHFLGAALFVRTVVQNFFVSANNLAVLAPPDLSVGVVGKTLGILELANFCCTLSLNISRDGQFFNGAALLLDLIEPGAIKALEDPLGPLVVLGVGGVHFLFPVIGKAQALDLTAEIVAVLLGGDCRVCSGLNSVLFCRQTEGVPTHGVQDVETLGTLVAANDIRCGVTFGVTNVEACATGIREHVQAVELGLGLIGASLEGLMFSPVSLPLGFNFLRIILCHFFLVQR
ncbi:hypothetical protein MMG03_001568 [Fibrobacter succinogenes]|nr:hypothetical protein [Fibrobacter succinogenes]